MSGVTAGTRVHASWLGGGFAPGTAVEVNPASGLVKVRFDDGREAWVSQMNVRVSPAQTAAPAQPAAPRPAGPGGFAPYAPPAPAPAQGFGAAPGPYGGGQFQPIQGGGMVGGKPFEGLIPGRQPAAPQPGMPGMQPGMPGMPSAQPQAPQGGGFGNAIAGAVAGVGAAIASFNPFGGGAPQQQPMQQPMPQQPMQQPAPGGFAPFNPAAPPAQAPGIPQGGFNPFAQPGAAPPAPQAPAPQAPADSDQLVSHRPGTHRHQRQPHRIAGR